MLKIGVLASGRGSNLQAVIDAIDKDKVQAQIQIVISDKADAYALERARLKGISTIHYNPKEYGTKGEYEEAIVEALRQAGVELVVLAGYMRLVGESLLEAFPHKIINIHPALLPAFPGLHGQKQALDYGVKLAGCTVHFVDAGMDTGPIILQGVVPVLDDDTEETLSARILEQEHKLLPQAIQLYAEGKIRVDGRKVRVD